MVTLCKAGLNEVITRDWRKASKNESFPAGPAALSQYINLSVSSYLLTYNSSACSETQEDILFTISLMELIFLSIIPNLG